MIAIKKYKLKLPKYLFFIFLALFFFRNSLSTVGLGLFSNLLPILMVALSLVLILLKFKIYRNYLLAYYYLTYFIFLFLLSFGISDYSSLLISIFGIVGLSGSLLFWIHFNKKYSHTSFLKFFLIIGVLNCFGTFINFFISESIFGLINHSVYTNPELVSLERVTRRGVSFISSPQSLSIYLSFCFVIISKIVNNNLYKFFLYTIFSIAILLTVSKAAFVFLSIYYATYYRLNIKIIFLFSVIFVILNTFLSEFLVRVFAIFNYALNIKTYSAYDIWINALNLNTELINILFGSGLGIYSRGGQEFTGAYIGTGSIESFFLQLYVETGLVGALLFLALIISSLLKHYIYDRLSFSLLLSFVMVSFLTPAIYGVTLAIPFYYLLIKGLNHKKD